jgi:hypothetical protein
MLQSITPAQLTEAENAALTEALGKNPVLGKYFEVLAHNVLINLAGLDILNLSDPEEYLRKQAYARGQLELLNTLKEGQEVAVAHFQPQS